MQDHLDRLRAPVLVAILLAILIGLLVIALRASRPPVPMEVIVLTPSPTQGRETKVYVSGAVLKPGVYRLGAGDRVEDAVKAAGGATAEADLDAINLATRVRDEMHVFVPKQGEVAVSSGSGASNQKISLSSASMEQLETLQGIGPVTAKRIIDHRNQNGPFKTIEELRDLKLVNSSTFDKIKDLIVP